MSSWWIICVISIIILWLIMKGRRKPIIGISFSHVENPEDEAISLGVRSFLEQQRSLVLQERFSEVSKHEKTKEVIAKLLKPAEKMDDLENVVDIVLNAILALPNVDYHVVQKELSRCIMKHENV